MKLKLFKTKIIPVITAISAMALVFSATSRAQTTYTINDSTAAAFMASGSPSNPDGSDLSEINYGNAGTLAIAPASSTNGAFDSVLMFNTASAVSQFNSLYGAGNWTITGVTLSLASNFGTQGPVNNRIFDAVNGGSFGIDWLDDNTWIAGNGGGSGTPGYPTTNFVDYAYIPTLLSYGYDPLGDYNYTPPGNNTYLSYTLPLDSGLLANAAAGTNLSLYFYAADNQISYLFNTQVYSINHPELALTVIEAPEPATLALFGTAGVLLIAVRRSRKS